jgi:hypothetical protein
LVALVVAILTYYFTAMPRLRGTVHREVLCLHGVCQLASEPWSAMVFLGIFWLAKSLTFGIDKQCKHQFTFILPFGYLT